VADPRKPDYVLKVLNKETDRKGEVGAAWKNNNGSISVRLNPCVILTSDAAHVYTLFPYSEKAPGRNPLRGEPEDDLPF